MVSYGDTVPSNYQASSTYARNVIDAKLAAITAGTTQLSTQWPAMAGLDWWITLQEGAGSTSADRTGNGHNASITGDTTTPAAWLPGAGINLGSQTLSIPNANGRPTYGFCAYFPAGGNNPYLGGTAAGGQNSFIVRQNYGTDVGHGARAFFPELGRSNGGPSSIARDGFSGAHCIEIVIGNGSSIPDIIVIDGHEASYFNQGSGSDLVGGAQLANAVAAGNGTIYSVWSSATRDTVQQAIARCQSEMQRLAGLGVRFGLPLPSTAIDSVLSITGTSIDQGFQASATPASRLALPFPCTVVNGSISGQACKDMTAGFDDREGTLYHALAARNIAYHGGVTNGVMNYLEDPLEALKDVLGWNRKAKAQGWKTVVSTMLSRAGTGFNNLSGDTLAQQFNALLLANGDEFDWVCNMAADPALGATNASANTTYFADGVHPNDTGQARYVAIMQAGVIGVYGNPQTVVSGNYTQLDPDRLILQTAGANSTLTLKNAWLQSFNRAGRLTIKNAGSGTMTINPVNGQTIDGQNSLTLAAGAHAVLAPYVLSAATGGASWSTI